MVRLQCPHSALAAPPPPPPPHDFHRPLPTLVASNSLRSTDEFWPVLPPRKAGDAAAQALQGSGVHPGQDSLLISGPREGVGGGNGVHGPGPTAALRRCRITVPTPTHQTIIQNGCFGASSPTPSHVPSNGAPKVRGCRATSLAPCTPSARHVGRSGPARSRQRPGTPAPGPWPCPRF